MLALDHVLVAVGDPASAAIRLERENSIWCVPGPVMYGGLAGLVAPLASGQFICCIYLHDRDHIPDTPIGRFLAEAPDSYFQLIGWAARTHDIHRHAARLRAPVLPQVLMVSPGRMLRWNAVADARTPIGGLPYFIEWEDGPGDRDVWIDSLIEQVHQPPVAERLGTVKTGVSPQDLRRWLRDDARFVSHDPCFNAISEVAVHYRDASVRPLRSALRSQHQPR